MENLNAEQVKKALECCIKNQCENCCQCGNWHEQWNCMTSLMKNALALINSQEQRIGKLEAENERLKAQKYYMHSDGRIEMIPTVESVRADTVRKMQERIKQYIDVGHYRSPTEICFSELDVANIIDRIAKEMLEVAKRREDIENSPVDCSTPSVTESQREADER